jgi:hypothetical protein
MCSVRTKIVPVTTEASGKIKVEFNRNFLLHVGYQSAIQLKTITRMSTAHSICKVLW